MRDLLEIRSLLHAYRDFSECIVEAIAIIDRGTSVHVSLDYIWQPDGSVRPDNEQRLLVELVFRLVQEFDVHNQLPEAIIADPSVLGWGFGEVARIEVKEDERSARYVMHPTSFHHLTIHREGGPWIDIVFAEMIARETWGSPPFLSQE